MLIPPSLLMIVYGVLSEESIGRMFIAGIVPGLVLAGAFCLMIVAMATWLPGRLFVSGADRPAAPDHAETWGSAARKAAPIAGLVGLVLGGLYSGFFTPTEAGAVGALAALAVALARRSLDLGRFWRTIIETGHIAVCVLFLIMAATLYSRMLALSGLPGEITEVVGALGLGTYGFLAVYLLIIVLLGCLIDSVSIMLIMLPIALPIATALGIDLVWFGVLTVVAVEIGLITPPFGISVFTVKATLNDPRVTLHDIFAGVAPFVLCMMGVLAVLVAFPGLSTWLARM
jgi:tripartite ATP-independent transporter DctM subunit